MSSVLVQPRVNVRTSFLGLNMSGVHIILQLDDRCMTRCTLHKSKGNAQTLA